MSPSRQSARAFKRFRVNPIEVFIFMIVSSIFGHSVYSLFDSRQGFKALVLSPPHSDPLSEGRSLASVDTALSQVTFDCSTKTNATDAVDPGKNSTSSKIKIEGPLCYDGPSSPSSEPATTSVINTTNQSVATVFTDSFARRFSTDYLPLTPGKNEIRLDFSYKSGEKTSRDLTVNRI
jgi:hypothetical protein